MARVRSNHVVFLRGRLVDLRPIERDDLPLLQRWINEPELWHYLKSSLPKTMLDEERWYEKLSGQSDDIVLAIVTKDGKLIGVMGIHRISWRHGFGTTGAFIGHPEYQNRGYGTDAKMAILQYAFNALGLRKIMSHVIAFNRRSVAYSTKCGYRKVGRLQQHFFRNGHYYDEIIMEVFKAQWQRAYQKHLQKFRRKSQRTTSK